MPERGVTGQNLDLEWEVRGEAARCDLDVLVVRMPSGEWRWDFYRVGAEVVLHYWPATGKAKRPLTGERWKAGDTSLWLPESGGGPWTAW